MWILLAFGMLLKVPRMYITASLYPLIWRLMVITTRMHTSITVQTPMIQLAVPTGWQSTSESSSTWTASFSRKELQLVSIIKERSVEVGRMNLDIKSFNWISWIRICLCFQSMICPLVFNRLLTAGFRNFSWNRMFPKWEHTTVNG